MVLKVGQTLLDIIQKSPKLAEELFDMMQKLRRSAFFDPTTHVEKPWLYPENVKTSEGITSIWKARNVDEVVKEKLPFLVEHRGIGAVKIPTKGDIAWKEGKMGDYVYYKNKELNEIIQDEDLMGRIMVDPRLKVLLNKEINDFLKRGRELAPYYTFPGSAMSKDPNWARAFARFDMDTKATEYDNFKSTLEMIHTQLGGHHVRFVERALSSRLKKMDGREMEYKPHPAIKHLFPEAKVIKLETKGKKSGTLTEKRNKAYEDIMKRGPHMEKPTSLFATEKEFAEDLYSTTQNYIKNSPDFNIQLAKDLQFPGSKTYGGAMFSPTQRQTYLDELKKIMESDEYKGQFGEYVLEDDIFKIKKAHGGRIGFSFGGGVGTLFEARV